MKRISFLLATVLTLNAGVAIAQEYSGNFWVNPQSGELESLDIAAGSATPMESSSTNVWVPIAQAQGGVMIEMDGRSHQQIQLGSINPASVRFRIRRASATGRSHSIPAWYQANCRDFDLHTDRQQIAISPGSVAEAIYSAACPNQ